uniref:Reverse transcriptase Ty1/copia-type domain-containing protein n=1 Tax=Amphimedon queenslandica TaxID=400682 RepID=A0A1X7STM5_AMPQE
MACHRYCNDEYIYIAILGSGDPVGIEEALESKLSQHWKEAADSEYQSLMDNETWELVELPSRHKPVGCKWVFKTKRDCNGKVEWYKARLVAKGYTQKHGVDYDETFSPVVQYSSIRALLAFAVQNKTGYVREGKEQLVCKLKKSFYGLKQSSRCWNTVFKNHMESINFNQCSAEPCIFVRRGGKDLSITAVYVDDLIVITSTPQLMKNIKGDLAARFRMKDLGNLHHCLGMTIDYDEEEGCLWLHQRQYISSLLERYGLSEAKVSATPAYTNVKLVKEDGSNPVDPVKYQSMVVSALLLILGAYLHLAINILM